MVTPFYSRDLKHKKPFGAIKCGQTVFFRLFLPHDCFNSNIFLYRDGEDVSCHSLEKTDLSDSNGIWWEVELSVNRSGLYFYYFDFTTPFGYNILNRGIRDEAVISSNKRHWQLTVYDKDFCTPNSFNGEIMYQIFPDRFCFSGEKKENVPDDRFLYDEWGGTPAFEIGKSGRVLNNDYWCGDLKGIESKLDYLKSLSIGCIYLNPIFEAHSNHRYNTANYAKIDPLLGNEDDFKNLCKQAHKRGIKIILDGVFSHTGSDSIYFNAEKRYENTGAANDLDSPYANWYTFQRWPDKYNSWWGFETLPEVNESEPQYLDFICGKDGIAKKWLSCGADGWRLDVADELPDVFLDSLRSAVKDVKKDAIIIGEVWEDASNKSSYGSRRRYLQGKQLDSVMNYPFYYSIVEFIRTGNSEQLNETVASICENYPANVVNVLMNHLGTHDTERIINKLTMPHLQRYDRAFQSTYRLSHDQRALGQKLVRLAAVLQYTLPGFPCIYYGDEIGMEGCKDPFNRAPFDYKNSNDDLVEFYINLGKIRTSCDCFKKGRYYPYWYDYGYISYIRRDSYDGVLTAVNVNDYEVIIDLPMYYETYNALMGHIDNSKVILPPKSAAIIKMNNYYRKD